ncbi:hypothetical protein ACJIZ3_014458 [Penstemon smallii]|uniref:Glycine-rich protein n=1 Tax=Penstemon smallii TaxID=265156 RepID=A0ABD3RJT8_9LAMI
MGSKAILLIGFFLAMVLLISSEVAAINIDPSTEKTEGDAYPGRGGYNRGGGKGGGYPGRGGGGKGGGYPGHGGGGGGGGGYPGHGGGGGGGGYPGHGGGGGGCPHGCCGPRYRGSRCRCCSFAGEKVDAQP